MRIWGRWVIAAAVIGIIAGFVWHTVNTQDLVAWAVQHRTALLVLAGLAVAGLLYFLPRRERRQHDLQRASKGQGLDPSEKTDPAADNAKSRVEEVSNWAKDLKFELRQKRWFRSTYVQPWVLVAGDSTAVNALVPELAQKGFIITDDVVLLWGALGADNRPDELWLRRIRRLRCTRPLDAIALVLDDGTLLLNHPQEKNMWGLHLARIREVLRWSAPVFVVDIAGADAVHRIDTPVTGCEFRRPPDASAVETALFELRDRLADRSVHQLATNPDDAYASDLSKRLDTRATPLARWVPAFNVRTPRRSGRKIAQDPFVSSIDRLVDWGSASPEAFNDWQRIVTDTRGNRQSERTLLQHDAMYVKFLRACYALLLRVAK